ncbi:aspartyl protease family protein 2 [Amborella trichopoda]|uniref:Peptidase A1 domain-containing protein n=1 Tax=Amborella trichopoda TaxID=13333 RepID=W1Q127_AMBTC|nr:aspartyl protease family protein 2 [Amborella trichopoda]ERN14095.1 hypothetical protein AMTR_s00021p00234660 [Amborella trichopoda]|eukprot:XP_006852628.1 aspartyl protease family protein 2 [Amborella trichopoda]
MGHPFFLFLLFFSFCKSGFPKPLESQTLLLRPLSKPPLLDEDLKQEETEGDLSDQTSLFLTLHHRDSLSLNLTAEELFKLRLERDDARVKSLTNWVNLAAALGSSHRGHHHGAANPAAHANGSVQTRGRGQAFTAPVVSGLPQGSGEYFARVKVGTPPQPMYMVLDTGSDLAWLQCTPCRHCYRQVGPIFNPSSSSSYSTLPCAAPLCRRLEIRACDRRHQCLYQVSYGDGSFTVGDFSTETLSFGRTALPHVALGCGHDNEGLFIGAAGLLGLGRGSLSLPSQFSQRSIHGFSYCLTDRSSPSPGSLSFGNLPNPSTTVFTTMIKNPKLDTFYYLGLVGISVGGARLPISSSLFRLDPTGNGGVIVDSGTSVTRLVSSAYDVVRDAFRAGATGLPLADSFSLFDTCYNLGGRDVVKVPTMVFHFDGGADLSLPASNYLIPVNNQGVFCFAFAGTRSGLSIIGNIQQQGFSVVFDGKNSRIGFVPKGCA